ncbi:MAG: hypothetical protein QXP98_04570 [Thermoproteus sp.]
MDIVEEWLYFVLETVIAVALLAVLMALGGSMVGAVVSVYRSGERDIANMTAFIERYAGLI